jgi:hypothetical protein
MDPRRSEPTRTATFLISLSFVSTWITGARSARAAERAALARHRRSRFESRCNQGEDAISGELIADRWFKSLQALDEVTETQLGEKRSPRDGAVILDRRA